MKAVAIKKDQTRAEATADFQIRDRESHEVDSDENPKVFLNSVTGAFKPSSLVMSSVADLGDGRAHSVESLLAGQTCILEMIASNATLEETLTR
jgi:hypothetical protein